VLADPEGFRTLLAQQGITPEALLDDAYNNQLLLKIRNMILETIVVTPKDVEREYRNKYEKAKVRYVGISSGDFRGRVSPSAQEVRDRFEATKGLYNQPEKYSFRVVVLDQERIQSGVQITDQELRNLYASAADNFRVPERVHARHILVSTEGKQDNEKEAARKKAEDLLAQIRKGANFAELATSSSDDTGTAASGGDLGFFSQGQMVSTAFDDAAFALKPNEVSNVVQTEVGYHIIQVLEKESARLTPFEEVRPQLVDELQSRKGYEQVDKVTRELRTELAANPAGAADIAKKYGGELVTVREAARGDPIPTLGVTPEIDSALAGIEPGRATEVLPIPGNRLVSAILDERIPGRPSTFEEAQAQVRDALIDEKAQQMAKDRAAEAADRIKKREDMAAVARSLGLTVTTSSDFNRTDTIEGLGPASYLEEAFTAPLGTIVGPREIQGRTVIAEVLARQEADMSNLIFERDALVKSIKEVRAQERDRLWQDSVLAKLVDSGDVKVYQDQIQLVTTQFAP
jgi:peptidyl-prolyl cis-trans isomerase D